MFEIMAEKNAEMHVGYEKPDPEGIYRVGWDAWLSFFHYYFAETFLEVFLLFSTAAGFLYGQRRAYHGILLGWALALGSYLVYFVSVKSVQYLIPLFLPLYGDEGQPPPFTRMLAYLVPAGLMLLQVEVNVVRLVG
jgi:hypothetical protein